jgi:methionyl-tRNA formyltransferase
MKIVIFGCQQIAANVIKYLSTLEDVSLPLVITYELPLDETYGYESVIKLCEEKNITVINPKSVNKDVIQRIIEISPDLILSIYYRKILPKELITPPNLICINIHPSFLPYYRGPVPTAWAIENGEEQFGITIHYMDEGIDTGDILVQEKHAINVDETGYELYTRAMTLGFDLFRNNFKKIIDGEIKATPQIGIGSYYGKKNGRYTIDWSKSTKHILGLIRVHSKPFNPAETILFNKYFLINKASEYKIENTPLQGAGKIIKVLYQDQFVVSCVDGYILIKDYEIAPEITAQEKKIYLKEGNKFE